MSGMRIDPKGLPLRHQEQIAMAIVERSGQSDPVAGGTNKPPQRVKVRRLTFRSGGVDKYMILKDAVRMGAISDLTLMEYDGRIVMATYRIRWAREQMLHTIPLLFQQKWLKAIRKYGTGCRQRENL